MTNTASRAYRGTAVRPRPSLLLCRHAGRILHQIVYAAQTQRAVENFPISELRLPRSMISATPLRARKLRAIANIWPAVRGFSGALFDCMRAAA